MITNISTTYVKKDIVDFIIDDDKNMEWIGEFNSSKFERFFIIIDEKVNKIWGPLIRERIKEHNKEVFLFEVEAIEESKSIHFYPKLVSFFEEHNCNLSDLVIVVGGGILIDLVSFTCSTYMRALKFYAIPTTLIGQIDASTAGKTCLNTGNSKNLLGTFYYPLIVYNNINFLKTNSNYYLRQGYSEVFKYGLLGSSRLVNLLSEYTTQHSTQLLIEVIKLAIETRIEIRKKHPLVSNLGHTFGHAIEKVSGFKILHGDAINVGTVMSLYFSKRAGLIDEATIGQITGIMQKLGLNMYVDKNIDVEKVVNVMMKDKKSSSKHLNLVLIEGIAKPYVADGNLFYRTTLDTVKTFLKEFMADYPYSILNCAEFIKKENLEYGDNNDN